MDIEIIALDLDQTILRTDKTISSFSLDVINKCKGKNILIAVATARSEKQSDKYLRDINPDIVISNGGAKVTYHKNTIHKCLLTKEVSNSIIQASIKNKEVGIITVDTEDGYYWNSKEIPTSLTHYSAIYNDFKVPFNIPSYKITMEIFNNDVAKDIASKFPSCNFINFSDENWYRFANVEATKFNAILKISQYLNIKLENIAAFGDDHIDIDMVKYCGIGVAMENGVAEIKRAADFICDTNDNDGVAKWLLKNI